MHSNKFALFTDYVSFSGNHSISQNYLDTNIYEQDLSVIGWQLKFLSYTRGNSPKRVTKTLGHSKITFLND